MNTAIGQIISNPKFATDRTSIFKLGRSTEFQLAESKVENHNILNAKLQ